MLTEGWEEKTFFFLALAGRRKKWDKQSTGFNQGNAFTWREVPTRREGRPIHIARGSAASVCEGMSYVSGLRAVWCPSVLSPSLEPPYPPSLSNGAELKTQRQDPGKVPAFDLKILGLLPDVYSHGAFVKRIDSWHIPQICFHRVWESECKVGKCLVESRCRTNKKQENPKQNSTCPA